MRHDLREKHVFIVHSRLKAPYEYSLFHNDCLPFQMVAKASTKGSEGGRSSLHQRLSGDRYFTFVLVKFLGLFSPLLNLLNFFAFVFSLSKILRQLSSLLLV